jgi:hypothetical protein
VSDAFIKWCRTSTSGATFLDRVDRFREAGISLIHPVRGTAVLLDVDGDDIPTTPAELASLVDRRIGRALTFEWWFSANVDLTCTTTFVPGRREIQTFYLDGLSSTEVTTTCDLIRGLFWDHPDLSDWLVLDTTGHSADFDWDNYLQYGVGDPVEPPDLLVLSNTTLEGCPGLPRPASMVSDSEFSAIARSDWSR